MFAKEVYIARRARLLSDMVAAGEKGIVLFLGNAERAALRSRSGFGKR